MLFNRIIGVFRLDPATFEEVEHDQNALSQAAIVVAIVALLTGLGSGFTTIFGSRQFAGSFFSTLIWTFVGWILWSVATYFVGTSLFGGKADLGEMLRVIGFAYAPLMLGIIPCIGGLVGTIWALVAGFIAIRQGLDFENTKAFLTVIVGLAIYFIGWLVLTAIFR
ncbi:MAG: YIP1 family protein [Omnitrophica WOR_2 bacterium]